VYSEQVTLELTQVFTADTVSMRQCEPRYLGLDFFCVDIMYSGEYDACGVTLSVYLLTQFELESST
jgi:hypothetical protein